MGINANTANADLSCLAQGGHVNTDGELHEIAMRRVCSNCIGETFLRGEINQHGEAGECFYCDIDGKTITVGELADRVEMAFDQHFHRTSTEPSDYEYMLLSDKESSYDWSRHGEPVSDVISNLAEIGEDLASDVQWILQQRHADYEMAKMGEECPFASDSYYEESRVNIAGLQSEWQYFEESLKTESRFFSTVAEATLSSIFAGLTEHKTWKGRRVVIEAGPNRKISALFRARVFESEDQLAEALKRPDRELGPPPPRAARPGRMNAGGVSVFYDATDARVALSEVRPPGGSRVVVARFRLIRPIKLLDVEALRSVLVRGSFFDPSFLDRLEHAKFLEHLSHRITAPVMPSDEPLSFLATQAIADYLATRVSLDGIIYPSAQKKAGKRNVALFHHAARVQALEFPEGTELGANLFSSTDEGPEIDYWVWEEVPPPAASATGSDSDKFPHPILKPSPWPTDYDAREPTLQIETTELKVHHVQSVNVTTESHSVRRHRWKKRDMEF